MTKQDWLDFWNLSGPEGEKAWEAKQHMDAGHSRVTHHVLPDIQPYQSMVDGSMIQGRRQHREHLKEHRVIEVGNEVKHLKGYGDYRPKNVKQDLIREFKRVTGKL
jgi:hypothetical protein